MGLEHGLGSPVTSSSGLEVGTSWAHQLVLVQGYGGALGPCPKNKMTHVQEKCLLNFSPTIWDKLPQNVVRSHGAKHEILGHTNPRGSSSDTTTSWPCSWEGLFTSLGLICYICKMGLKRTLPPMGSCKDEMRQALQRAGHMVNPQSTMAPPSSVYIHSDKAVQNWWPIL